MRPGSSPLARGLLKNRDTGVVILGIIPARAGFTWPRWAGPSGPWDHPRSRGVYLARYYRFIVVDGSSPLARGLPPTTKKGANPNGSSPLARGLRSPTDWHPPPRRIIPARAGFTRPRRRRGSRARDHPRSRGVYASPSRRTKSASGSSPLARGLRHRRRPVHPDRRIIPARAGFTVPADNGENTPSDHPRSRGVYRYSAESMADPPGSSPLARGLLCTSSSADCTDGIIPARAGFTDRVSVAREPGRDHPRSRGVYIENTSADDIVFGSSPLARGLRVVKEPLRVPSGIIPARAGFTRRGRRSRPCHWDHPRSRGVYNMIAGRDRKVIGSSPLARGLRRLRFLLRVLRRIIPARAGFTTGCMVTTAGAGDHPRSRGVYDEVSDMRQGCPGSSPLARGLRYLSGAKSDAIRIIPARAGFTTGPGRRSCGRCGSSPLARGLLHEVLEAIRSPRIIPARAGFTRPRRAAPGGAGDHPRSRGVYPRAGAE